MSPSAFAGLAVALGLGLGLLAAIWCVMWVRRLVRRTHEAA